MSGAGAGASTSTSTSISTSISTSPSPGELLGKITEHATKAVSADAGGRYSSALCSYNDALKAMLRAAGKGAVEGQQPVALGAKFGEYADRASQLLRQLANKPSHGGDLEHAQSALRGARLAQRRGQTDAALGLYIDGIGSYQKVLQQERAAGGDWVRELRRFANLCLSEAESVKAGNGNGAGGGSASDGGPDSDSDSDSDSDANADAQLLTREEAAVVRRTSLVNGLTFLPWVRGDSGEAFGGAVFSDKDGLPALSAKQQRRLVRWRRAGLAAGCTMFAQAGCEHIVQEMVTDCSFVAALCASVEHERRFSRQVVTRHVYPRRRGQAAVSGSGKYLVKLFVNGLWRRVVIDDRLPAGAGGRLLCTYSTRGDIGPSLLEKAFLKVMGGYDFPGSNSSTDLHVLTGWVPEHVFVHDAGFDAGATWARLADGARRGTVLATIATGEIGATAAGALGLVPAHAYAVLDVREVCGERLLKLKNPWSALRWTGRFSPDDAARWTPALMRALGYDPAAEREDCGLFWIDYASACQHFDAIHLNWDPRAFAHSAATHFEWAAGGGPQQALYDFSGNPQFTVVVGGGGGSKANASAKCSSAQHAAKPATVWALLSKHLLKTAPNGDFIALHVYAGGQRVYEPRGALLIGEYTNAPHVLVRLSAAAGARYTLVVAQRDKTASLFFTLRLLGDAALQLSRAPQPAFSEAVQGQWGSASAGGNSAAPRYLDNPQYRLTVAARASGVVALRAAQAHAVNVRVFRTGFLVTRVLEANTVASSGKYRARFCTCALDALEPGSYTLVASTFEPFLFSRFTLTVGLDAPFALAPIAREGAGMRLRELHGRWTPGAPPPRFLVQPPAGCSVLVRLQTPRADPLPLVSVAIFEAGAAEPCASSGSFANSPQGVATQPTRIGGADYLVVPAAWGHGADAAFVLYFYSQHAVEITALADQQ